MEIKEVALSAITPYTKNAKDHPKKQIEKVAASIREFGFNQPIVVDKDGVIIVGHGRYLAAQALKLDVVPVLEVDLDEERAKAYRLADNKLNESEWDRDIVIEELKSMSLEMIDLTGFDSNLVLETKEDKPDLASVGEPRSQLGDIYELGRHKVICGDSMDENTYKKLLGEEKPRLIFTDPPYSIDYHSVNKKGKGLGGYSYNSEKFGGTGGRIFNDDKTPQEALEFYRKVLLQLHKFSTDDATIYWWFATRLTDINMQALREEKWHYSQTVFWLKNSLIFSPGQLFHRIYEPCMVAWKEGKVHFQNRVFSNYSEFWALDKKTFPDYLDVWYSKRDNVNAYIHPTQKPVQLAERAIKRSSDKNDIVIDAFGGSGSTLIACDQLDRSARLIELDPKYVDAIVGRWCKYKDDPTVVKNGKSIQWTV